LQSLNKTLKRYLLFFAGSFVSFLIVVVGLNVWVDPYRIWNLPGAYSEANPRPRAVQQVTLLKIRGVARTHPRTLILGSSRTEIGLDPTSPQWPKETRPVYNASIPGALGRGAGLAAAVDALKRSEPGEIRHAVIGLDFLDFLVDADGPPSSRRDPPISTGRATLWHRLATDLPLALSLDTLIDSLVTIYERDDPYARDVTGQGFNPVNEYRLIAAQEGYGALFLQRDSENARAYARLPKSIFEKSSRTSDAWTTLEQLIDIIRTNGIEATFIIYPYHAHILEMFHDAHLVPAFEAWKMHLATTIHDAIRNEACPLWDFSGYHAYAKETVPPLGDRTADVKWYWESGHFKRELGERMLARVFHDAGSDAFGVCLTPANVEGQNLSLQSGHNQYQNEAPRVVAEIAELMRKQSRERRSGSAAAGVE
jgi:hypothetical protein